jgi:uncharacterized protein YecE (DUF72 family)
MPDAKTLAKWADEVPDRFTFVLKAPQRITHHKKLIDTGDDIRYLFEVSASLGKKLGPVLFQLPPFLKKDADRLRQFLRILPPEQPVGFEFRHESWFDDEVYTLLKGRNAALCVADTDETPIDAPLTSTASWGYLRLRRTDYSDEALHDWRDRVEKQNWDRAFVFFKHEDEGRGPMYAMRFLGRKIDS